MKIALLTDGVYPFVIGGMQVHSFYMAKYLAQNKVKVLLFHPITSKKKVDFYSVFTPEEKEYIEIILIETPKQYKFSGHYIYESFLYSKNIYEKLKGLTGVDFIYAQGFTGWEYIRKRRNEADVPSSLIGVNLHGLNMFQPTFGIRSSLISFVFRYFAKYNLCNSDVVFSLGGKLTDVLKEKVKWQLPIIEIPIGIDRKWLITSNQLLYNKELSFVFIGRFDKIKGFDILNEAISRLNKNGIEFKFHFVGAIPRNCQIDAFNIIYHDEIVIPDQIKKILRESDVLVCPSYSEGMPTVILEAMSCGLAIIASDVGAVSEQVSEKNGILIKPGSVTELEKAILEMCNMKNDKLLLMKQESLKLVAQKFLWDKVIQETIEKITEVVKKNS